MSRHLMTESSWERQRRTDQLGAVIASVVFLVMVTSVVWAVLRVVVP